MSIITTDDLTYESAVGTAFPAAIQCTESSAVLPTIATAISVAVIPTIDAAYISAYELSVDLFRD